MIIIQVIITLIIPSAMIISGRKLSKNMPEYKSSGLAYKTYTASLSEETWVYANRLFANMLFTSGINVAIVAAFFMILAVCLTEANGWALALVIALFEAVSALLPIAVTEKLTVMNFDENGNIRKERKKKRKK